MLRVSEIITSPVISLYESKFHGIVYNAMFDIKKKKCKYLCVLNEEDGIQRVLDAKDIYHIGDECVFIKNNTALELECNFDSNISSFINPLNLKIYNLQGKLLGTSTDIILDNKLNISSIELNTGNSIPSNNIINFGRDIILVNEKSISIAKFKPKNVTISKTTKNENKVVILSSIEPKSKNQGTEKIITDFRFLIGRTLLKDVKAINGELIAKKDTLISKDIINRASLYGRLVELTRYSKKTNQ